MKQKYFHKIISFVGCFKLWLKSYSLFLQFDKISVAKTDKGKSLLAAHTAYACYYL